MKTKTKKNRGSSGDDVIKLNKDDYKQKSFPTAPGGKYKVQITTKSAIKPGRKGGNQLAVHAVITKGPYAKKVSFFDNIAPTVGWKIAQLLHALGVKKMQITLKELLKLIKGKELRAILREETFEGKKRNKVVQWLPLDVTKKEKEEDDDIDEDEDEDDSDDDEDEDEEEDEDEDGDDEEDDDDSDDDDDEDGDDDEDDDDADEDEDEDEDDDDEEDDDEDEDEEEEVKKSSKKKGSKKTPAKSSKKKSRSSK